MLKKVSSQLLVLVSLVMSVLTHARADDTLSYAAPNAGPESIIYLSDIDDTIIQSNVANKLALVRNSIMRKPKNTFKGMANLYEKLLADNPSARVLYLSGTPELMRKGITRLLKENGFPKGNAILRRWIPLISDLTWGLIGDTIFSSKRYKIKTLRKVFRANPDKKFVLIGDDVEYDPDVYRQMAKEFPGQVKQIYIRRVLGRLELDTAGIIQFSTEWHIGMNEWMQNRLSGESLKNIGQQLIERLTAQPHIELPRWIKSILGFGELSGPVTDIGLLAHLKALTYDIAQLLNVKAHCEMLLLGGETKPPEPPEPPAPPPGL